MNKNVKMILSLVLLALFFAGCQNHNKQSEKDQETSATPERIISLDGAITAIIADLGRADELVGRDVTSTYPSKITDTIKDLGHVRSLSMEAIMALHPTLILASSGDMNPKLAQKIEDSGIQFKLFEQEYSIAGTKNLIKEVADFIGSSSTIQPLLDKIDKELAQVKTFENKPKVLFIYARGAGTMMVAGQGTSMGKMISLAGGINAAAALDNFKPLTTEALLNINPDVILLFHSGLESLGGIEGLLKVPGVMETNAGQNRAVITMKGGLISNFGPRVGKAAHQLNRLLSKYAK